VSQDSGFSALTRTFFENKKHINDGFLLGLLAVLEMYNGPITLEILKSGLATASPEQHRALPSITKSALARIRRNMNYLSERGLVITNDDHPDGNRGRANKIYELPDNIRTELNVYRKTEALKRGRLLSATMHLSL
jgi:hypothetical protein